MFHTIISGGQTGVDRAALRAARGLGLSCGGWCPKGRQAEDGVIPREFALTQTDSDDYEVRTRFNVRDSDATLIVSNGPLDRGTELTAALANQARKPYRVVDLACESTPRATAAWINTVPGGVLNVAGPRESNCPGIETLAEDWLRALFAACTSS